MQLGRCSYTLCSDVVTISNKYITSGSLPIKTRGAFNIAQRKHNLLRAWSSTDKNNFFIRRLRLGTVGNTLASLADW